MSRRARIWLVVAVLFVVVNVGGTAYAAAHGELWHTGIHAVLAYLGAYLVWRLWPRRVATY